MLIPLFVGVVSGTVGVGCWTLMQVVLSQPAIYSVLEPNRHFIPPLLGVLAAALFTLVRASGPIPSEKRTAIADLFESYHFALFILRPVSWFARGLISLLNAFVGGTFGVEGGVLELSYATLPLFSKYRALFVEEKQAFILCTVAASLGVALGAPFSGALIALELIQVLESRVRTGAVVAALTAYGTAVVLGSTSLLGLFTESAVERHTILGSLFAGMKPANLDFRQWIYISVAAAGVGVGSAMLATINNRALAEGHVLFSKLFGKRPRIGPALKMILAGVLMGVCVWLVPQSFGEPWRTWEDLAWLRLSSKAAMTLMVAEWSVFVLAFSGWGSSGLFSPILQLGALWGYVIGNAFGSNWAIPLAVAGGAAMLSASFRIPIAAAALVLEVGRDGPMWWLAILAVASASLVSRLLGIKPLHEMLLEQYGLRVVGGRAVNLLSQIKTRDAMYKDAHSIAEKASLEELREAVSVSNHNFLAVESMDGKYLGLLALEHLPSRIRRVLFSHAKKTEIDALARVFEIKEIMDEYNPTVSPNDSCEKALQLLQGTPCVAVVDDERKLCGFLFESSIAGRYKREIANTAIRKG